MLMERVPLDDTLEEVATHLAAAMAADLAAHGMPQADAADDDHVPAKSAHAGGWRALPEEAQEAMKTGHTGRLVLRDAGPVVSATYRYRPEALGGRQTYHKARPPAPEETASDEERNQQP
jgi:hypothetical protein